MTVRDLMRLLVECDPDAELMTSTPMCCSRAPGQDPKDTSVLWLPTWGIQTGSFEAPHQGVANFVSIRSADVWGVKGWKLTQDGFEEPPVLDKASYNQGVTDAAEELEHQRRGKVVRVCPECGGGPSYAEAVRGYLKP